MNRKKILENNEPIFLEDLKKVSQIMVFANKSNTYLGVLKKDVTIRAETTEIRYYLTDKIFVVGRLVMVVR